MSPKTRKLIHEGRFEEVQEKMKIPILAMTNRLSIEYEVPQETIRALSTGMVFSVITREVSPKSAAIFGIQAVGMFSLLAPQLGINEHKCRTLIQEVKKELEKIAAL